VALTLKTAGLDLGLEDHWPWLWPLPQVSCKFKLAVWTKGLQPMLEKVFSVQATSAPVERVFSQSGMIVRPNRARLGERTA